MNGSRQDQQRAMARIIEEAEIARIASEIDRAVDDKEWPRMRRHFAEQVEVDIGAVGGEQALEMSGDSFVAGVAALNGPGKTSYHSHSNALITIEGDIARFTSHSYGWSRNPSLSPSLYEVWGTMDYGFKRAGDGWLVSSVRMAKWRESGNPAVSEYHPAPEDEEEVAIETPLEEGDANAQPV